MILWILIFLINRRKQFTNKFHRESLPFTRGLGADYGPVPVNLQVTISNIRRSEDKTTLIQASGDFNLKPGIQSITCLFKTC
jgi:hypothetical protein